MASMSISGLYHYCVKNWIYGVLTILGTVYTFATFIWACTGSKMAAPDGSTELVNG